jgi:AraC-like DNA-binding protein
MEGSTRAGWDTPRGVASAVVLCDLAAENGVDRARCLRGTGITPAVLGDPDGETTATAELRLIENLVSALDEPEGIGLQAGLRYRLTTYGIWSYALVSSRTVTDAHQVAMQFVDLTYACTSVSATEDGRGLHVTYDDWDVPEPVRRFVLERDTAAGLVIWREGISRQVVPQRVQLRLPEPRTAELYARVYGVRPEFGATSSVLTMDRELLNLELPQASEPVARMCVEHCRDLLDKRALRRGVSGRVRDELLLDPRRMATQDEVAARLHVSVRTLRRQLADEGTTFRGLVENTRAVLAEELLPTGRLTVEQVADRVGYSEASSFVHAFTRWKGVAPRRWARQHAGG